MAPFSGGIEGKPRGRHTFLGSTYVLCIYIYICRIELQWKSLSLVYKRLSRVIGSDMISVYKCMNGLKPMIMEVALAWSTYRSVKRGFCRRKQPMV